MSYAAFGSGVPIMGDCSSDDDCEGVAYCARVSGGSKCKVDYAGQCSSTSQCGDPSWTCHNGQCMDQQAIAEYRKCVASGKIPIVTDPNVICELKAPAVTKPAAPPVTSSTSLRPTEGASPEAPAKAAPVAAASPIDKADAWWNKQTTEAKLGIVLAGGTFVYLLLSK